jgi:8-oxo-dGTP pyrophosphatase MutT (NUDIX family)
VTAPRTFTHPDVLAAAAAGESWADPETDPTRIDWTTRQATAAIPFKVIDGRPVNPCERTTVRYGRNELGHWGEALAADALVTMTSHIGQRWLLMVERSDGHGWALPGGHLDPGETPEAAAVRELAEETGLLLPEPVVAGLLADPARYVPDPRASDEAWMVTFLTRIDLGTLADDLMPLPPVTGSDDAARAAWIPAQTYDLLEFALTHWFGGGSVFQAHRRMLADVLGRLDHGSPR